MATFLDLRVQVLRLTFLRRSCAVSVWMLLGCKRLSLPAGGWRPKVGDVCPQAHACVDHRFTKLPLASKVVSLPTCPCAFSYTWWKIGSLLEFSQGVGQLQFREIQCELPVSTRHCFARSYCPLAVCWHTLEIVTNISIVHATSYSPIR